MKNLIIPIFTISLAGCGGAGGSGPVGGTSSTGPITLNLSNPKALLVGESASTFNSTSPMSFAATGTQKGLFEIKDSGEVAKVQVLQSNQAVDAVISKNKRVGHKKLLMKATIEGSDKNLLVDTDTGSTVDLSAYSYDYSQVRGNTLFAFKTGDATTLYKVDLTTGDEEAINTQYPIVQGANLKQVTNAHLSADTALQDGANDFAFLLDSSLNVLSYFLPSYSDAALSNRATIHFANHDSTTLMQFGNGTPGQPDSYDTWLTGSDCGGDACFRAAFYNKNGKLFTFILQYDGNGQQTALSSYEFIAGGLQVDRQIIETLGVGQKRFPKALFYNYSIYDTDRYVVTLQGAYHLTEDSNGVISVQWIPINFESFTAQMVCDPIADGASCRLFDRGYVSGDYVYWQNRVYATNTSLPKIYRLKLDGSSSPETFVDDPALNTDPILSGNENYDVAQEQVLFKTNAGVFSMKQAGGTAEAIQAGNPDQIVEIK